MSQDPESTPRPNIFRALYHELNRRGVLRVAGLYIVASWAAIQASDTLYEPLGFKTSPVRTVIVIALVGFPIAVAGAWFFNLTRDRERSSELTAAQYRIAFAASGAFALVILLFGGWLALRPAGESKKEDVRPTALQPDHIAVLYFTTKGKVDPQDDYLADALTETLIDQLAKQDSIFIISSNGVKQYRNTAVTPDSIAKSLNVGTIVSGSVWATPDSIHVNVSMVTPDGRVQAAREVVVKRGETFALVDNVVRQVSDELRSRIGERMNIERWRRETQNDSAWSLVQRAYKLEKDAHEALDRGAPQVALRFLVDADSLVANAERLDVDFSHATIARGWLAYFRAFTWFHPAIHDTARVRTSILQGYGHAARALVRHPGDPQALEVRGGLATLEMQLLHPVGQPRAALVAQAEADLRTAGMKDPGRARALSNLSALLYDRGDYAEAQSFAQQAYAADSYLEDKSVLNRLFVTSFEQGRDEDARTWCNEINRRDGGDMPAVFCLLQQMAFSTLEKTPSIPKAWGARANLKIAPQLIAFYEPHLDMLTATVIARAGRPDSARAVIARAASKKSPDPELLLLEAGARVQLKQRPEAKALVDRYIDINPAKKTALMTSRRFASLYTTPQ
jgi:TolB-like protein/Tfp pilus assembly protein PilF